MLDQTIMGPKTSMKFFYTELGSTSVRSIGIVKYICIVNLWLCIKTIFSRICKIIIYKQKCVCVCYAYT